MSWILEDRILLAATPVVNLELPASALVNEEFTFPLTFDNVGSPGDIGYGPYAELIVPPAGADTQQVQILGATYQGAQLPETAVTFDQNGNAQHPLLEGPDGQPLIVTGPPGGTLFVFPLPFGSYSPEQPPIQLEVQARMIGNTAEALGTQVNVTAGGGFYLGLDPLDDPSTDPPIIADPVTEPISPAVMLINKQYLGPEGETATGPNYVQAWQLNINIADGQTIDNLVLSDDLAPSLQFVSASSVLVDGTPVPASDIIASSDPSTTEPGGLLSRELRSVIGTTANPDVTMDVYFYVPQYVGGTASQPVLDPATGNPTDSSLSPINNTATAGGTWVPASGSPVALSQVTDSATVQPKALAVQKQVSDIAQVYPGVQGPGDVLQYTINFQVSDYFALQNLVLNDAFSDGQSIDTNFTPTLQITGQTPYGPSDFTGSNFASTDQADGTTTSIINVSQELIDQTGSGILTGGRVGEPSGAATGQIIFRTVIDATYKNGGAPVTEGDKLSNDVTASSSIVGQSGTPGDTSSAGLTISTASVFKTVYAVNGELVTTANPSVTAGDLVTFELTEVFPLTSYQDLTLTDYLPLPLFSVSQIDPSSFFQNTTSSAAPPANEAWYGPTNTFPTGTPPSISTDPGANSVTFQPPPQSQQAPSTLDILFTVVATDAPLADQLLLTNQVSSTETSTQNNVITQNQIAQVVLSEPLLVLTKGAVSVRAPQADVNPPDARFAPATVGPVTFTRPGDSGPAFTGIIDATNLAADPITSAILGLQAGDMVKFALVVENTGTGPNGAFNVVIQDQLPTGFVVPQSVSGFNLQVTDGTGTPLAYRLLSGGLLGQGIELTDDVADNLGALAAASPTSGKNLAVVTFNVLVSQSVAANATLTNTGQVTGYSSTETGPNFLTRPLQASALATTLPVTMVKSISSTSESFTAGSDLAIGEVALYSVVLTVPQGTLPDATVVDSLPSGLALVNIVDVTANSPNLTTSQGSFAAVASSAFVQNSGQKVTYGFGVLTNSDRDDTFADQVTITYNAVALDVASNTNGARQTNTAVLTYTGGSAQASTTATILVPKLTVQKSVDKPVAQALDTVTYTVVVSHAPTSGIDAFDINLSDVVPAGVTYVAGSWAYVSGVAPASLSDTGGVLQASIADLPLGQSTTLTYQGVVAANIQSFQTVTNTANITYTTLPGSVPDPISPYNPNSTERTQSASGSATFSPVASLQKTIIATSLPDTAGNNLTIGEVATFQIQIAIPRGVSAGAQLIDTMPAGMALVALDTISADSGLTTTLPGGFPAALSGATINSGGIGYSLNLGTITNSTLPGGPQQYLTLQFRAVVLNVAGNQNGTPLQNSARFQSQLGGITGLAPAINVVTPRLSVVKTVSPTTSDPGEGLVTFTIVVSDIGTAPEYDVSLADLLPTGLIYDPATFANTAGLTPTTIDAVNLTATFTRMLPGVTSTFTFQATPAANTTPGQVLTNSATASGSSLPGDPGQISPYNASSTERIDSSTGTASVTLNSNSLSGTVYLDYNDNGSLETGEPGLPGVTVVLTGTPDFGSFTPETTTTDTNGVYSFTGLAPGTYTITEDRSSLSTYYKGTDQVGSQGTTTDPSGTLLPPTQIQPPSSAIGTVRFFAGASVIGQANNFAELPAGSLAGTVYVDVNNSGSYDPSTDTPLPGVTISLAGTDYLGNVVSRTTTTATDGSYGFAGLAPGVYSLTETLPQPVSYSQGTDTPGTLGGNAPGSPRDFIGTIVVGANNQVQPQPSQRYDGTGYNFGELIRDDDQITKTASTLVPAINSPFTYTLTVQNNGPSLSEGTVVTDPFDSSLTILSWSPTSGVVVSSNFLTWTIGDLPAGNSTSLVVTAEVTGFPSGPIVNTATVVSTTIDIDPSNNTSTVVVTPNSILSGYYYLDYGANGTFDGYDAPLAGQTLELSGDSGSPISAVTNQDGFYLFPNVGQGTWTISASDPPAGDTFFQSIPGTLVDGSGNVTYTGVADGQNIGQIEIPLSPVQVGSQYNFAAMPLGQITGTVLEAMNATSAGTLPIPGVTVTLTGTTFAGQDVSTTTTTGSDGGYAFNDVVPGAYQVTETQPAGYFQGLIEAGTQGGVASSSTDTIDQVLIGPATLFQPDQVPANKPAFDPTSPAYTYTSTGNDFSEYRLTDLEVLKSVDNEHPEIGGSVTYTVTVRNIGPSVDTGVVAQDLFPAGMTVTSANPDLGSYDTATGVWTIGDLKGTVDVPGETAPDTATMVLTAIVPPPTLPLASPYVLTNTIDVSGDKQETTYTNNHAEVSINPLLCDLVVGKTVDNATPSRGDTVTFTVTLTNTGPDTTSGVILEDIVPAGLDYVPGSVQTNVGSYDPTTGLWTVGTVPVGQTDTMTFQTVVDTYDPVVNMAEAFGSTVPETDLSNNEASVEVDPLQPALEIHKAVVENPTPHAGEDVVYDITLLNNGLGAATGVTVPESAPSSLTYVSSSILDAGGNPVTPPAGGSFDPVAQVWNVGTVGPGEGYILRLVFQMGVTPNVTVTNTASIKDPNSTSIITEAESTVDPRGVIDGRLFWDSNLDQQDTPDDPGLADVSVALTGIDPGGQTFSMTTTTDSLGDYEFRNVTQGSWTVSVLAAPAGYLREVVLPGTLGGTATPSAINGIPVSGSLISLQNDFGFIKSASLSGYVVWDLDHNMERDSADFGLGNVTMTLQGTDYLGHAVTVTAATNILGYYTFANLAPGTYKIIEGPTPPLIHYGEVPGTAGGKASTVRQDAAGPAHTVKGQTPRSIYDIALQQGVDGQEYDFFELQRRSCQLRQAAMALGNEVFHLVQARDLNPASFDKSHPSLGADLAAGQVPRALLRTHSLRVLVRDAPTAGTKRILASRDPRTGKLVFVGVPTVLS